MKYIIYLLLIAFICSGLWMAVLTYYEQWEFWGNENVGLYEKRVLNKINLLVLLMGMLALPIICKLLYLMLPAPFSGEGHIIDASHNGSAIFVFIVYEGIYYLWLKRKLSFKMQVAAKI